MQKRVLCILLAAAVAASLALFAIFLLGLNTGTNGKAQEYTYSITAEYPHDPNAFTQGLAFYNGSLYEGTGLYGNSSLREVDLETGQVMRIIWLSPSYFGEGIAVVGDRIIQLTWKSQTGFVYARENFTLLREFQYTMEGWGIAYDGQNLFMSDGTATIRLLDPANFSLVGEIHVHDYNGPVALLNELEYVEGEIFANVWMTDRIARISPTTGEVLGWIDLTGLSSSFHQGSIDVLNGIAYDSQTKRLFVTGKLWPSIFEIEITPKS